MTEATTPRWNFKSAVPDTDSGGGALPEGLNPDVPHIARIYDYWLGGKDNFAADRAVAEKALAAMPGITESVRTNRAFLRRAVSYLASEVGIRQFLDIGTGLPSADNTHEVAQRLAPSSLVVYVDKDPIVLLHARALLTTTPEGKTAYLDGDVRDPSSILAAAAETLDLSKPVALMLIAIMHCVPDEDDPYGIVHELSSALPSGSYLVLSHPSNDVSPDEAGHVDSTADQMNRMMPEKITMRGRDSVKKFFDGWDLVDPGIVPATQWRANEDLYTVMWAGVARKP